MRMSKEPTVLPKIRVGRLELGNVKVMKRARREVGYFYCLQLFDPSRSAIMSLPAQATSDLSFKWALRHALSSLYSKHDLARISEVVRE